MKLAQAAACPRRDSHRSPAQKSARRIPSFRILLCSVPGLRPSRAAAPYLDDAVPAEHQADIERNATFFATGDARRRRRR